MGQIRTASIRPVAAEHVKFEEMKRPVWQEKDEVGDLGS